MPEGKPELDNGYTPLANELLEALYQARLSSHEWAVLMCLARATYGWKQKVVKMPVLEIARRTTLQPNQVYVTIKRLRQRQMLLETADGLGIQKYLKRWNRSQNVTSHESGLVTEHDQSRNVIPPSHEMGLNQSRNVTSFSHETRLVKLTSPTVGVDFEPPKSISKSITKTSKQNKKTVVSRKNPASQPPLITPEPPEEWKPISDHLRTLECLNRAELYDWTFWKLIDESYPDFPDISIVAELSKAEAWCLANPRKSKTRKNWKQFIRNWFDGAAQRKARNEKGQRPQ